MHAIVRSVKSRETGGGRGIRTPGTLSGTAVFKTACFNRSHIPPRECYQQFTTIHERDDRFSLASRFRA
jgi:hypothetical protein